MDGRGAQRGGWGFCHSVFVQQVWRSAKHERIYRTAYDGVAAAHADIADYFNGYNIERLHSSLELINPALT